MCEISAHTIVTLTCMHTHMYTHGACTHSYVGAKEINLAATVEYLRDQRPNMVRTKVGLTFCEASISTAAHTQYCTALIGFN